MPSFGYVGGSSLLGWLRLFEGLGLLLRGGAGGGFCSFGFMHDVGMHEFVADWELVIIPVEECFNSEVVWAF